MPLSIKVYDDKIQELSATADDSFEISRVAGSIDVIENLTNNSVTSVSELPSAADNTGRIVYIENICQYYKSNGLVWNSCFTPPPPPTGPLGGIWGWGGGGGVDGYGRLGTGLTYDIQCSPVSISGGFTDWCQVSGHINNAIALRSNGTAWSWGRNCCGVFGNGTADWSSSPVSVVGGFTDWCQVSAGENHVLALRTDGTAWSWGRGGEGQLGRNITGDYSSPVSVVGGFTDWCQISAGRAASMAVRSNGTLWGWGIDCLGNLGINSAYSYISSPVSVVGGFTDWCQVSHTSINSGPAVRPSAGAVRTNGTIWMWGQNKYGQLGTNNLTCYSSPVSVVGGFTDWCRLSVEGATALAIRANGTLWAWGQNYTGGLNDGGFLADGTIIDRSSPVSVVGGFTDWVDIDAAYFQMAGVRADGTLWTWGISFPAYDVYLGHGGAEVSTSSPVTVAGGFTDWTEISGTLFAWHGIRNV